jgi:putative DNA primase/helicase
MNDYSKTNEKKQEKTQGTLSEALKLAALGNYVFPCNMSKNPKIFWKVGASKDPAKIKAWGILWDDSLTGIYCKKSGIFALDVDNKGGVNGTRSLTELVTTHGGGQDIEAGPIQTTPNGGYHILFRHPDFTIPNNASKLGPGLDLRSEGYICTGVNYTWQPDHGPETQLTEAPAWLLDLIRKFTKKPTTKAKTETKPQNINGAGERLLKHWLARATPGNRNNTGFDLACQLRDNELSESEAKGFMRDYARSVPGDGYTEKEALASLREAYKGPKREPATLPGVSKAASGYTPPMPEEPPSLKGENGRDKSIYITASRDHGGHADCAYEKYGQRMAICEALGWQYYTGKHWERHEADHVIAGWVKETLKLRAHAAIEIWEEGGDKILKSCRLSRYNVTGTMFMLESEVYTNVDKYDNVPELLNCDNGALDLRTGELIPHSPDQKFTYTLPVAYDPQADTSEWLKFLSAAVPSEETREFLRLAIGYSLTGYTWEEVLFYITGPTRSGKGTFTETILKMMGGKPLATEADFETFTASRTGDTQNFDLAPLKPCRFVAASESNRYRSLNAAKIKTLTGGNYVYCAFKRREHFNYRPQFKIWLSSNHPINLDVTDDAAWSRVRVIPFPVSFLDREDKELKARLAQPENLAGVLRWAVSGAKDWFKADRGLTAPQEVRDITEDQRRQLDYIGQFLDECTRENPGGWVLYKALRSKYLDWCKEAGIKPMQANIFGRELARNRIEKRRKSIKGERKHVIEDLEIV